MMSRHFTKTLALSLIFLGLLIFYGSLVRADDEKKPGPDLRTVISQVTKANLPAVVHIKVTQTQKRFPAPLPLPEDPFWQPLFPGPLTSPNSDRERRAMGSGVIMDEQGHVLTNQHLVMNAEQIQIILANNQLYNARLLGADSRTDLAVLQIQGTGPFAHVNFGNSDQLELGEWVIALGHNPEAEPNVTHGIICAKHHRSMADPGGYKDFIQTDAVINGSNSGGPLLNLKGEVIGINVLPSSRTGRREDLSFAVPGNTILQIAKRLITSGKMERAWIGVSIQDLMPEQAQALGLEPSTSGALVMDLVKDGPADQGGFKKGDVVISFQDKEIRGADDLQDAVANGAIGQEVKVLVFRKGAKVSLKVKLGKQEEMLEKLQTTLKYHLGAELRAVTEQDLNQAHLTAPQGVMVVWIDPSGPLHEIGLEKGDIILQMNGRTIRDQNDLSECMQAFGSGQLITLLALDHRSGRSGYIQVTLR
jgi:serine protease Do